MGITNVIDTDDLRLHGNCSKVFIEKSYIKLINIIKQFTYDSMTVHPSFEECLYIRIDYGDIIFSCDVYFDTEESFLNGIEDAASFFWTIIRNPIDNENITGQCNFTQFKSLLGNVLKS